jgi:hypothetical protein
MREFQAPRCLGPRRALASESFGRVFSVYPEQYPRHVRASRASTAPPPNSDGDISQPQLWRSCTARLPQFVLCCIAATCNLALRFPGHTPPSYGVELVPMRIVLLMWWAALLS